MRIYARIASILLLLLCACAPAVPKQQTYTQKEYGYSVSYPSSWSIMERANGNRPVTIFQSLPDKVSNMRAGISIEISNALALPEMSKGMSAADAEYFQERLHEIENSVEGFQLLHADHLIVGDIQVPRVAYSMKRKGVVIRSELIHLQRKDKIFEIAFVAPEALYDRYFKEAEAIIASITFASSHE